MQSKSNIICIYVIKLYWKRTAKWLLRFLVRINREDEEKCFSLNVCVCVCTHICVYVYWIHCELEFLREIGKFILIKMTPVELESRTAKNRDFFRNKLKLQERILFSWMQLPLRSLVLLSLVSIQKRPSLGHVHQWKVRISN